MKSTKEEICSEIDIVREVLMEIRDKDCAGNVNAFVKLTQLIGCLYSTKQDIQDTINA